MKKIVLMSLLFLCGWISAGAVDLNKENRDPKYVESIVNRSQKIVDKLGLTDAKVAEDVCNVIANRYFELNDIYEIRDAKVKAVKESGLTGDAKNERFQSIDGHLYQGILDTVIRSGSITVSSTGDVSTADDTLYVRCGNYIFSVGQYGIRKSTNGGSTWVDL